MKGIFLALVAAVGILGLIGFFFEGKETQPRKIAPPAVSGVKNGEGVEFFVVEDNAEAIARYEVLRPDAERYLGEVFLAVDELMAMKKLPEGAELPAQSRKMTALAERGDVFGTFIGPDQSYLYQCRSSGIAARQLWNVMAGFLTTETQADALESFNSHVRDCISQIKTSPKSSVTLLGPAEHVKPPFKGCLSGGDGRWTCPSAVTS